MISNMAPTTPKDEIMPVGQTYVTEANDEYQADGRPAVSINTQLMPVSQAFPEFVTPVASVGSNQRLSPIVNGYASSASSAGYATPPGAVHFQPYAPCQGRRDDTSDITNQTIYQTPVISNLDYVGPQSTPINNLTYQTPIVSSRVPYAMGPVPPAGYSCVPLYQAPNPGQMMYQFVNPPPANYISYYPRAMPAQVALPRPDIHGPTGTYQAGAATYIYPMDPSLTKHLEIVWHGDFNYWTSQFKPDEWTLEAVAELPVGDGDWTNYKDHAKVRFSCSECFNAWTSMVGLVLYRSQLTDNNCGGPRHGNVQFRLLGQMCKNCKNGRAEQPLWYPEEVRKVVKNIFLRIGHQFYGFPEPQLCETRRPGKPRGQHKPELCPGCKEGHCRQSPKQQPITE